MSSLDSSTPRKKFFRNLWIGFVSRKEKRYPPEFPSSGYRVFSSTRIYSKGSGMNWED
ncbi:hypothetical protein LEP1GSC137_1502 [Leptospira borgpetersenii str. Noumea 25]|nr:hypothetical protein LEP1GSC137_1502 [Leptospira borgpetersenii str. Noumea 25]